MLGMFQCKYTDSSRQVDATDFFCSFPQIKEPGTQISSQPKIKEVEQAPSKREQVASPQRNIINTGKLIFKAKQAHLPKLSNLR